MGAYPESAVKLASTLTWDEAMRVLDNAKAHLAVDVDPRELASNRVEAEIAMLALNRLGDAAYGAEASAVYARYEVRHAELVAARVMKQAADKLEKLERETVRPNGQRHIDVCVGAAAAALRNAMRTLGVL